MRKFLLILVTFSMLMLTACQNTSTKYTEVNTVEGIEFTMQEDTLKSTTATFVLTNDTDKDVSYSKTEYHLEEDKDGAWVEFTGTSSSDWSGETDILKAGESVLLPHNWKALCGATKKDVNYRFIILVDNLPVAYEFVGK